jgi:hypothetical protein
MQPVINIITELAKDVGKPQMALVQHKDGEDLLKEISKLFEKDLRAVFDERVKQLRTEKIRSMQASLKEKYKEVYAEKAKLDEIKRIQKERDDAEQKEAYIGIHKEKLRRKNLKKEIANEFRRRRIEKDIKENQRRRDEKAAENRKCTKPYRSPLECEWNYECPWGCGYVHLNRATKCMKSNCCFNGKLSPLGDSDYFKRYGDLEPLSDEMRDKLVDNIEHIGPLSSTYGNVLSLAAIGVENGNKATGVKNTHPGGFENRGNGAPDCVTMYGRTFHYLTVARDLASGIGEFYYTLKLSCYLVMIFYIV